MSNLSFFVACPFSLFPLDDYKKTFHGLARKYKVAFKFADEQITNNHILEKITGYIRNHDISLFDITGWNPNVALELGIAVGLKKKYFILLNTKIDPARDAPSDLKGIDRIQYVSNSELETKLIILIKQEMPTIRTVSDNAYSNIRKKVTDTIRKNPGLTLGKISEAAGEDKTLIQSMIRALVQEGNLKVRGQRKGTVYYPESFDMRKARSKK